MEEFVKADIFFFVTAIAVVAVTVFVMAICVYVLRILSDAKHITGTVRKESDEIISDVGAVRRIVERGGKRLAGVVGSPKKRAKK
ncbi:MAG: hypothetical protein G01um101448_234 [Parcubacteria group bacterium Gr01-1014_48]|nr:MAG: hypothetical protein Greene041614_662 [Parcubacteria group bacterium Greene0416_14]TSC74290.1 MAG: hypothetical protein G01um101448_234 [Parcubacteria group bacterium Gr01-1014_48]TSC99121.1 MAG: hypothetical protein Greene101415_1188 [Parcubacteria group bacterium Greene1014_15]TSD06699.1 MAG: hypothetical protein Greene07144_1114 [Parcubacteria group bacterium Greene0714_4]